MKAFILAATVAAIAAGGFATSGAEAGAYKKPIHGHHVVHKGKVTPGERAAIKHSHRNLARIKARAHADGKLTLRERVQIKHAKHVHAKTVKKALR